MGIKLKFLQRAANIFLLLMFAGCFESEKKTTVEVRCKDSKAYEICVSDKSYFVSLMATKPTETTGFMARLLNFRVQNFNRYSDVWIGNQKLGSQNLHTLDDTDSLLDWIEARLLREETLPKAKLISESIYIFQGHFFADDRWEGERKFSVRVYPSKGDFDWRIDQFHLQIESFGFGTKEQNSLELCTISRQVRFSKNEPLCPATFIVSSYLKPRISDGSIEELVYHLEAIKFTRFDKADYLQKLELQELRRLEEAFEEHQKLIAKRLAG